MVEPTASERLLASFEAFFQRLVQLSPGELALNLTLSFLVVAAAVGLAVVTHRAILAGVRKAPGPPDAEKTVRTTRVARFTRGVVDLALTATALILTARIWGVDLFAWMSQGLGERLAGGLLHIAILLVLGFAALELAGLLIDRLLGRMARSTVEMRRAAQLRTLTPVLRSVAHGIIIVIFSMMILAEAGVQIGPLLAGAGVVGLAVGFGAQTLVKDFLTGFFLIAEDIVSVGDVVQIQGSGGLVEEMTLRTIRLRDFDGTLHVFPYGEAQVIHNLTKTFSFYVFELQISYESDVDRAMELMRETGAELMRDETFKDSILEPIEVVGVDGFADSGVKLKARIKTLPIRQWAVGREFNRRIKKAFEREGIQIPYPHIRLVAPTVAERGRR